MFWATESLFGNSGDTIHISARLVSLLASDPAWRDEMRNGPRAILDMPVSIHAKAARVEYVKYDVPGTTGEVERPNGNGIYVWGLGHDEAWPSKIVFVNRHS